jgi:excisionase family DNA binding protein
VTATVLTFTPRTDRGHATTPPGPATPPPTPITRAVYTVAEVAELLDLSLGSTYALVRTGDIPAKKMGGRWVIPKRRFHAWLDDLPEASLDDVARELARLDTRRSG